MDLAGMIAASGARPERARGAFDTTHWSLVVRGAQPETVDGQAALEELCRSYWYPVYCFARRHCASTQDAEDLTQGFFADLLERGAIARADVTRGRFRTFLLCSFQNFCSHERVRAGACKRGGDREIVSLEALQEAGARLGDEPATEESAERAFDRKWAIRLIERALSAVRVEYEGVRKGELFDVLKSIVWGDQGGGNYAAIAARFHSTPGAIKVAVFRLRRRLGQEIRTEVGKTVTDPEAIEDEMRHLIAAVGE